MSMLKLLGHTKEDETARPELTEDKVLEEVYNEEMDEQVVC